MWNTPTPKQLEKLPRLYETENIPSEDKIIHMHFFLGGSDWYMAEYSPKERIFFGYTILNQDYYNSEWGYTSLDEMVNLKTSQGFEIDRDLHWKHKRFKDIDITIPMHDFLQGGQTENGMEA